MEAEHARGPVGGLSEADDRHRGGVRGQDRLLIGDDRIEFGEDLLLDLLVLAGGFDDELTVGHRTEVGGEGHPAERLVAFLFGHLAALDALGEGLLDARAAGGHRLVADVADDDVKAGAGEHLSDARSHQAAADDSCTFNGHWYSFWFSFLLAIASLSARP